MFYLHRIHAITEAALHTGHGGFNPAPLRNDDTKHLRATGCATHFENLFVFWVSAMKLRFQEKVGSQNSPRARIYLSRNGVGTNSEFRSVTCTVARGSSTFIGGVIIPAETKRLRFCSSSQDGSDRSGLNI